MDKKTFKVAITPSEFDSPTENWLEWCEIKADGAEEAATDFVESTDRRGARVTGEALVFVVEGNSAPRTFRVTSEPRVEYYASEV